MAVNGKGLAAMGVGAIFVWSGLKGWSVLGTVRDLVSGVKPNQPELLANTVSSVTGLAGVAQQYVGHAYSFGGAPGTDGSKPWDCSSFVNYVVSKTGRAIPGYKAGTYDGSVHGPTTLQWAAWPGLVHIDRSQLQAGDIIIWAGHMGIAVDGSHLVSALNESEGTKVTGIDGTGTGPILVYGRLSG